MFTDLLDGESRRADIVIDARLKSEDTLIIIDVEPQSYEQPEFHERMYLYYSLLYNEIKFIITKNGHVLPHIVKKDLTKLYEVVVWR